MSDTIQRKFIVVGGAGVTAVTATAPLASSGGATPDISILPGTAVNDVLTWDGVNWVASPGGTGDVVGPAGATDNAIARYDGITGKLIKNSLAILDNNGDIDNAQGKYNGVRNYNSSAVDPILPVPADGDRYYNTALEKEMRYDGSRSKWLSVESATFVFSRVSTAAGSYFQHGNVTLSPTQGWNMPYNGTIVAMGLVRSNATNVTLQAREAGVSIASLALGAATKAKSSTTNADIAVDSVLAAFNNGLGTAANGIGYFIVKWRV